MSTADTSFDLASLLKAFANVELLEMRGPDGRIRFLDHLLIRKNQIKLKIYQERGHQRPHFHVDYGRESHVASYAIDSGERLDGTLHPKYDKAIASWTDKNRELLLKTWSALQAGQDVQLFVQMLPAVP